MKQTIVPPSPGNFSAIGAELAEVRYDYVRTNVATVEEIAPKQFNALFNDMRKDAALHLKDEGFGDGEVVFTGRADMRYAGQAWELGVNIPTSITGPDELREIIASFEKLHKQSYGYVLDDEKVVFVNLRLAAIGVIPKLEFKREALTAGTEKEAFMGFRQVFFGDGFLETSIYDRDRMAPGTKIHGPAIIQEYASTILVDPQDTAEIDAYRNIIIRREGKA